MTSNQTTSGPYTFQCTDQEQVPIYSQVHYDDESYKNPSRVLMTVSSSSSSGPSQMTYSCKIVADITQQSSDAQNVHPEGEYSSATKPTWLIEKEILGKLERDMLQYMDTRSLIPLLKARGMISQDDEERINHLDDGSRKQSKYILDIVPKKGERALLLFLKCLQEEKEHRGHDTLAKMLLDECSKAGYVEIQRGEAWRDIPRTVSRCASCGHTSQCEQIDIPVLGTPMSRRGTEVADLGDRTNSEEELAVIKNLAAELKVWKEVADKFINENLTLKIQNVELKHENDELKRNQQIFSSRCNSALP